MITREEFLQMLQDYRGVEDPCPSCDGMGVRAYGDTSTWVGGIGGQMITQGVCDKCWGSGDKTRPWLNLRKLSRKMSLIRKCENCQEILKEG